MNRDKEANYRRNAALNHIANLTPEQRLELTAERLMDAFGLPRDEAVAMVRRAVS